ncbi:MAG: ATP-binding protein [Elusimicrobiota bacterium]
MFKYRFIEPLIKQRLKQYPVVTLTGPRQSGKTTICKELFPKKTYLSLENLDTRRRALIDPKSFIEKISKGAILDEIQRAPELLSFLQTYVDEHPSQVGTFILTGSAQFELLSQVSQSLAGRTSIMSLLPFSLAEAYPKSQPVSLDNMLYTGFYPRIFDKKLNPTEAMASYCATYLERDVRSLLQIKDLSRFEIFLRLVANRTGQLLNSTEIGTQAGVNHNSIKDWMSVLQASYIVYLLKPHHNNLNKRLVKSPKIHFLDSALVSYLVHIESPEQISNHALKGYIFESFVVSELLKQRFHSGKQPHLYFWRDNAGHEIDVLLDFGNSVLPVEVKSGKTISSDYFDNINYYRKLNKNSKVAALIYGGDESYIENNTWVLSFKDIHKLSHIDYRLNSPL